MRAFANAFKLWEASIAGCLDVLFWYEYQPGTPTIDLSVKIKLSTITFYI